MSTENTNINEPQDERSKANEASLLKANEKLGKPITYFLKKHSVEGSLEKGVEEASEMFQDLVKLKESGEDTLLGDDGNLLIEKLND